LDQWTNLEAGGADEVAHALEGVLEARDVGNQLEEHRLMARNERTGVLCSGRGGWQEGKAGAAEETCFSSGVTSLVTVLPPKPRSITEMIMQRENHVQCTTYPIL
jgi:hypothetical protein